MQDQLTFLSEAPRASPSALRDSERDWQIRVATSPWSISKSLIELGPGGWSGRTSPASYQAGQMRRLIKGEGAPGKQTILTPSSVDFRNSGMGGPGECLTLSTSEWNHTLAPSLRDDGVCSLSDILETGDVPQRYFLSAKACEGILRRAEKRGKELPELLARALRAAADSGRISS